jgi:hypothetical protein
MSGFSIYLVSVVGIGAHSLQVCYLRLENFRIHMEASTEVRKSDMIINDN